MAFWDIPTELVQKIFQEFEAEELALCCRVTREWRQVCADNYLVRICAYWWKLCMKAWYDEANRPTTFSKLERKRNWKESYLKVTGLRQIVYEKKPRLKPPPKVWPTDPPTKTAQREYYKSFKHQKLRGKSPERCQKDFLATFVHNDD